MYAIIHKYSNLIKAFCVICGLFVAFSSVANAEEGDLRWSFTTGGYVHSSPAVAGDGTVYVGSYDSILYAVNPDGSLQWQFTTGGIIHSSPAVGGDGTVYVGSRDNNLYAVNADGSQQWRFAAGGEINASPALGTDGRVYFGSNDGYVYALSAQGLMQWRFATSGLGAVQSSPRIGPDGAVYVGADETNVYALNADGSERWRFKTRSIVRSTPALGADGTLYVGSYDKSVYALNADGSLKWEYPTGGAVHSSPAIAGDGTVIVGSFDGKCYALNPDGSLKWSYAAGDGIFSSPRLDADGIIYFGANDASLYALNADGSLRWTLAAGDRILSSPAIGLWGTVYVGSRDQNLYAVEIDWVPDLTPPEVRQTTPADAAENVAVNTNLTAQFSEALDPTTVSTGTFSVSDGIRTISGSISASQATAGFNPVDDLEYGTVYTATLHAGIADASGNAMPGDYVWSFTTRPDNCPEDPLKADPGICGCGVPDADSDEDGVWDCDDAFPDDPGEWADADSDGVGDNQDEDDDNDGMPDQWETDNGLNPLDDADAGADPDGDGLSNLEEYQAGTDPFNAPPQTPVLLSPPDGQTGAALAPELTTDPFSDPDAGDIHAATRWQLSRQTDFSTLVFEAESPQHLTMLSLPDVLLDGGAAYVWRARFVDDHLQASAWASPFGFTTMADAADGNVNGVPDDQEVGAETDLDSDGTPDSLQIGMKTVLVVVGNVPVSVAAGQNMVEVQKLKSSDPAQLSDTTGRPDELPIGLLHIRAAVSPAGGTSQMTIYFSDALPAEAGWIQYDPVSGWQSAGGTPIFDSQRRSVSLSVQDGGAGDIDGTANGVILHCGGPGFFLADSIPLVAGWQMVSLYRQPPDADIETVLAPIAAQLRSVWTLVGGAWRSYNPQQFEFSDLALMESGRGYWIEMTGPASLPVQGSGPVNSVSLQPGWNLVGFGSGYSLALPEALAGIQGQYQSVWGYMDGVWRVYDPENPAFSDLTDMQPGKAYWINAYEACVWVLP